LSGARIRAACGSRGEVSRFTDRLCGVRPRRRIGTLANEEARTRKRGRAAFERARYGRHCSFGLEQCTPSSHGRRRCEVACKPAVEPLHAAYLLIHFDAQGCHEHRLWCGAISVAAWPVYKPRPHPKKGLKTVFT
jgi:hypothetical protein